VLAIRSQAAEVKASDNVVFDVLYAHPLDDTADPLFDWALCNARKPLAESGPMAHVCLQSSAPALLELGTGASVTAQIPADVCQGFGPLTPVQKPGDPAVRPQDPDTTGGYYQPVRLLTHTSDRGDEYEVGVTRLLCGIALGASQEDTVNFNKKYRPNTNPAIDAVSATPSGSEPIAVNLSPGAITSLPAGAKVQLQAQWANCAESPNDTPCAGAEGYIAYDAMQQSLVQRHEAIQISWYTTDGAFEHDRTGRAEQEAAIASSDNVWAAPDAATNVRFWVVIRDDRRGVGWVSFDVAVMK
jgi:hypothetical protein